MQRTLDPPTRAGAGLEDRLALLRPGLDQLGLPACVLDRDLRYRYVNAGYAAHAGRTIAEFLGRTPNQVFAFQPQDDRRQQMQRALAGESVVFYRQVIEGPEAGRWVRAHYVPLEGDDGTVIGVLAVLVDVQQLKDTEQALAERERQLSLIMDAVGFPITYIDRSGVIRFANKPSCEWSGRTPETMIGRDMNDIAPPAVLDSVRPLYEKAFAGEPVTYEREALWPGREKRRIRGHLIPDRDASGEVRGILSVLFDIDEDHRLREALNDQRKQLQLVIDNIGVPLSYIDRERRFRFANQPGSDWQLASPEQALGKRLDEVFDAETMKVITPEVDRAFRGEKRVYERLGNLRKGDPRWVRVHLVPDIGAEGEVNGVYSLVIDVDEDHRLREALQLQEARLRFFAENIPGPIAVVDADFRYLFANKHFQRLRGMTLEEIVGKPVREVLGPEAAELFFEPFVERLLRGETCSYERLVGPPGGEARWHLMRLAPIIDPEGRFSGYYIVGSDIHDMKLAQERLREREAQLRLYTDNIPDAVAYLDRNRVIRFVNKHFAEQRGIASDEMVGRTSAQVLGEDVAAWIRSRTDRVFERGEVVTYERLITLPGGARHWFHVKAVPHFDESGTGHVRGMYVVAHDINEVKEVQERLAAREEELRFFAENIPEAIAYIDLERGCTFINNLFLSTRGISREEALGKFPEQVYSGEVLAELAPHLERVVLGEERVYERLMGGPAGAARWVRVRLTPRRDASGVVRGYYVVSTDIHDIKAAQAQVEEKERQLRQVIDSIPTPMVYVDAELRYRYVNDAFLEYIGLPPGRVIGHAVREVLGEARWASLGTTIGRVQRGETVSMERLVRFADGRERWMTVRLTPRMAEGRFLGYYSTTSDINEQKQVEEELRRANSILSAHFDNTPLAVIEWDTDLRIVRWSGQAEIIFGWQPSEALGRPLAGWRLVYEEDEEAVGRMVRELVDGTTPNATLLHRNYRKDGSVIWVEWHNSALRGEDGRVISILSLAQDVSSRIQAEERLQYMATHDGLTGLPNTVLLNDRLGAALSRARRARRRVGVMFLDLDHFKDVNDTLGHRVGDGLLKELANRIRGALRQSDVLARISGDEFVVVLEDLPDEGAPERVARKMLEEVRRPFQIEGNEIHVSGSLGLAVHPEDGLDAETLLKNADAAMYHAKELGRNSFRLFSAELAARRTEKLQIETALRRALRESELVLHFQPIVDVLTGEVDRAEALLRWNDPQRGLTLPQGFIPLADETGLGHAIGHWVLQAACRQARAWRDAGLGNITVCVNLSAAQLRDTTMVADLRRILTRTGCEAGWLQLEITETSMVRDVEGASVVLAKLRSLGVRIAIDDFGTGFSSLSHLRHLPVDVLKIDKAFVADIDANGRRKRDASGGAAIVSAVIGLAKGLGLSVVAEGVERRAQMDFLTRAGCPNCQGYLFSPPLPADEFEKWYKNWKKAGGMRREARGKAKSVPKSPASPRNRNARTAKRRV